MDLWYSNVSSSDCHDIAYQLVNGETGKNLNVILGGGRKNFLPKEVTDEEGGRGERLDGNNLIEQWRNSTGGVYVYDRDGLLAVPTETDHLLGLFSPSHLQYYLDADPVRQPTLAEMVEAAVRVLNKTAGGYFLFVEGGRIDHAHHETKPKKALEETIQFSDAVQKAVDLTDEADTLIVVTSDHAHTMTLNGYPDRGHDILGIGGEGSDSLPYSTLSYANGPGYKPNDADCNRHDITGDDMSNKNYAFPALVPLSSETHGGDDVAVFASGPWSHFFTGVMEQNVIPHAMAYASCVGNGVTVCDVLKEQDHYNL